MNFYKHHIGDYDADTAHLSWLEDAAYRRLMCLYYRREQPIPADVAQACRLVRASTKQEREAVETVLREFFTLTDDGWRQARCDGEIEAAKKKADANRTNGQGGGRPRATVTQAEPKENPVGFHEEPTENLSQTPDTRHQTPEKTKRAARATTVDRPPDVGEQVWQDWVAHRKAKRSSVSETVIAGTRAEAAKAGMSLEDAMRMSCRRGWQGFDAAWVRPEDRVNGMGKQAQLEARNKAAADEWLRRKEAEDATQTH